MDEVDFIDLCVLINRKLTHNQGQKFENFLLEQYQTRSLLELEGRVIDWDKVKAWFTTYTNASTELVKGVDIFLKCGIERGKIKRPVYCNHYFDAKVLMYFKCCSHWFPCAFCHNTLSQCTTEVTGKDLVKILCLKCHTEQAF